MRKSKRQINRRVAPESSPVTFFTSQSRKEYHCAATFRQYDYCIYFPFFIFFRSVSCRRAPTSRGYSTRSES